MDLFQFNDDFIAMAAWGWDNKETLNLFTEAIRAGADVLEERLIDAAGRDVAAQTQFAKGGLIFGRGVFFDVPLDEEQYAAEYGDADTPPNPVIRQAIIRSAIQGSREMSKVLGGN